MAASTSDPQINISLTELGEDWQEILECPVCMELLSPPKVLPCGHSLCGKCEHNLVHEREIDGRIRPTITCPTCRKNYNINTRGMAVNYVIQEVISFLVQKKKEDSKKNLYICCLCLKEDLAHAIWSCKTCDSIFVCSDCACENHRDHEIQRVSKIIDSQKKLLNEWRDRVNENVGKMIFDVEDLNKTVAKTYEKHNKLAESFLTQVNEFNVSLSPLKEDKIVEQNSLDIQPLLLQKERLLNDLKEKHKKIVALNNSVKNVLTIGESNERKRKMNISGESMDERPKRPNNSQASSFAVVDCSIAGPSISARTRSNSRTRFISPHISPVISSG